MGFREFGSLINLLHLNIYDKYLGKIMCPESYGADKETRG